MSKPTGEISRKGVHYHGNGRLMMLKKFDHALVFRGDEDGNIGIDLYVAQNKKTGNPENGGLIISTMATNIFDQNFMNQIIGQIQGIATMKDGEDEK